MRAKVTFSYLAMAILLLHPATASAATFAGKLWLLANGPSSSDGLPATFPPPAAAPDATFSASHISFFVDAPPDPNVDNGVGAFLNSAAKVADLKFSGLTNPAIDAVVNAKTPVVDKKASECTSSYGTYMELTGIVRLTQNERLTITHDDGVSLEIDGTAVPGLTSGNTGAIAETFVFAGLSGSHTIDLVYANVCGAGLLSFSPAM